MKSSKLTSKFQATIPKEIRQALKLQANDYVSFQVLKDGSIKIAKLKPLDREYYKSIESTFNEWNSPEDDDAFEHLQNL